MSFLGDYGSGVGRTNFDPGGFSTGGGFGLDSSLGRGISSIADPMDLFGSRSAHDRDKINDILQANALANIQAQRKMTNRVDALYEPYRQASLDYLPTFNAMAAGGGQDMQVSDLGRWQMGEGTRAINGQMAAGGMLNSSARGGRLADYYGQVLAEDANRQYAKGTDMLKLGTDAVASMNQSGQAGAANVGGIYSNWGNMAGQNALNYGQNRASSFSGLGNALSGVGSYMAYNQGMR